MSAATTVTIVLQTQSVSIYEDPMNVNVREGTPRLVKAVLVCTTGISVSTVVIELQKIDKIKKVELFQPKHNISLINRCQRMQIYQSMRC